MPFLVAVDDQSTRVPVNCGNAAIFPRKVLRMTLNRENPSAEHLDLLYRVSRALLKEGEYGELLSGLLDTLIEGLGADRGFVIVREDGQFQAAASRNLRSEALSRAEEAVSRFIANRVMESGRTVLIGDASIDEPYSKQPSIQQLSLRSVLCAPLVASQEAFALINLENRQVTNCFTEEQRDLLDEICALAAPRLRTAVAMSQAQHRAEAPRIIHREADGILTADRAMERVLQTVQQIAPTDLPVLIEGETGTGKESIARARRSLPSICPRSTSSTERLFVSCSWVNCRCEAGIFEVLLQGPIGFVFFRRDAYANDNIQIGCPDMFLDVARGFAHQILRRHSANEDQLAAPGTHLGEDGPESLFASFKGLRRVEVFRIGVSHET